MTQLQTKSHPSSTKTILKASGLNVYYGESHILRNVDLHIPEGEMICLIGRNGVGKTTFLKTIIGLLEQRSGSIEYDGVFLSDQAPYKRARRGIGYVSQGRDIIPRITVKENLMMKRRIQRLEATQRQFEAALVKLKKQRDFSASSSDVAAAEDAAEENVLIYVDEATQMRYSYNPLTKQTKWID